MKPKALSSPGQATPIPLAGEFPIVQTSKASIAFTSVGFSGCMFTEIACLSTVQIVDQAAGQAKVVIMPTALWTDYKADVRTPFIAVIEGNCTWDEEP